MSLSKPKDYTLRYALIPMAYWCAFCAVVNFASYYLLDLGFSNSTIGMIMAIAGAGAVGMQTWITSYADKSESISLKNIVLIAAAVGILMAAALIALHRRSNTVSGVVYCLAIMLLQLLLPLTVSLGSETLRQGKKLNYGVGRAMGSLAYAALVLILGWVTTRLDSVSLPVAALISFAALGAIVLMYPFRKTSDHSEMAKKGGRTGLAFFRYYKKNTWVLLGCVCLYIGHIFINNFTLQIVQYRGGSSGNMGIAQAISAASELPVMFLFSKLLKKAKADFWMKIAAAAMTLKCLLTAVVPGIPGLYAIQLLQMPGWAVINCAQVYYVSGTTKPEDAIKGQTWFGMAYTLANVVGALVGGVLLDAFSAGVMMVAGTVISALGMIAVMVFSVHSRDDGRAETNMRNGETE